MNQLKILMESELLTDEVKQQLTEAVTALKAEFEGKLEAEYASKSITESEKLDIEIKLLITESVTAEITELKADIAKYRKLEIEYAGKLETFKEEYKSRLSKAVETFVTESIQEEVIELKSDLLEAKKENFGRRIFESYSEEFSQHGFGGDMKDMSDKLKDLQIKLTESEAQGDALSNEKIKTGLLSNLTGKKQKIMETLLEGVSTNELEGKYNASIDFVLDKSSDSGSEDNKSSDGDRIDLNESALDDAKKDRLKKLLGR